MKSILIENKGNSNFKLTVTPTEVRIKLKKDATEEEQEYVMDFLKKVANMPAMINCDQTWRGKFRPRRTKFPLSIQMMTNGKPIFVFYPYSYDTESFDLNNFLE